MDLLARARDGDNAAMEALLERHGGLIRHVALRFAGKTPLEDLIQEGRIGFWRAVQSFNPSRKVHFATYAYRHITGGILHYLRDRAEMIRVPAWAQEAGKVSPQVDVMDFLPDRFEPMMAMEERLVVRDTLSSLSEREQAALWSVGVEGRTFQEAGDLLGVSSQNVHKHFKNGKRHFQQAYAETK